MLINVACNCANLYLCMKMFLISMQKFRLKKHVNNTNYTFFSDMIFSVLSTLCNCSKDNVIRVNNDLYAIEQ
jgi:hypothetical protein